MIKDGRRNLVEMESLQALVDEMLRNAPRWPTLEPPSTRGIKATAAE